MAAAPRPTDYTANRLALTGHTVLKNGRAIIPVGDRGSITFALDKVHSPPQDESRARPRVGATPAVARSSTLKPLDTYDWEN